MASFLNHTADDLNLPELGVVVKAGEVVETVVEHVVEALRHHPHFDEIKSPPPDPVPVNTAPTATEEVTS